MSAAGMVARTDCAIVHDASRLGLCNERPTIQKVTMQCRQRVAEAGADVAGDGGGGALDLNF